MLYGLTELNVLSFHGILDEGDLALVIMSLSADLRPVD